MADPTGKVLIVDDDRFVRMALSEALRTWEYEIVEADTVKTAKKVFTDEEPDIVLLDIDLAFPLCLTAEARRTSFQTESGYFRGVPGVRSVSVPTTGNWLLVTGNWFMVLG